jgi:hypothetical protein
MRQSKEVDELILLVPDNPSTRSPISIFKYVYDHTGHLLFPQNDINSYIFYIENPGNDQMCSYPRFIGPLLKTAPSYESQGRQGSFYVE